MDHAGTKFRNNLEAAHQASYLGQVTLMPARPCETRDTGGPPFLQIGRPRGSRHLRKMELDSSNARENVCNQNQILARHPSNGLKCCFEGHKHFPKSPYQTSPEYRGCLSCMDFVACPDSAVRRSPTVRQPAYCLLLRLAASRKTGACVMRPACFDLESCATSFEFLVTASAIWSKFRGQRPCGTRGSQSMPQKSSRVRGKAINLARTKG